MINSFKALKWILAQTRNYVSSIVIIITIGSIIPLCGVGMAIASKILIDSASANQWYKALIAAISFGAVIIVQIALQAAVSKKSVSTFELISNNMRKRFLSHLLHSNWRDISKYHSGDTATRLTSDVGIIANGLTNVIPSIISLSIQFLTAFITLMVFEPILAILALLLAPTAILFSRILGYHLKEFNMNIQEREGFYRSFLQELLLNIPIIKSFCNEKSSINRFDELQHDRSKWVLKRNHLQTASGSILSLGYWASYFIAFCWGAINISKGTASFGTLAAFLQLVEQIQNPFFELSNALPQLISTVASADRLRELEQLKLESTKESIPNFLVDKIQFDNVSFSYDNSKHVLKSISATVYSGEIIGLTGPSGEGKTTLIRMLLSLISPQSGCIYLFDKAGRREELSPSSRSLISYVPQGNTLFSGTIEENLRMGNPQATISEINNVLNISCAWDFTNKLPDGINTKIGEYGFGLSEGQAQRITIARALLHNAPILILDEATSHLDICTEINILKAIRSLAPSRICIIVSHRTEALKLCHRVFKLQNGNIMEFKEDIISDSATLIN